MNGLDLPDGFDDAPADVQQDLLSTYQSEDLVAAIREELNTDGRATPQLNKSDKAAILIALRDD